MIPTKFFSVSIFLILYNHIKTYTYFVAVLWNIFKDYMKRNTVPSHKTFVY